MQKILAFFLFLFFSPIFLLVSVLIFFFDPGPIFFIQKRVGLNFTLFNIYKFRTMSSVVGKKKLLSQFLSIGLENITPLGMYLRKYSLDELPQLFNIIKGDMNFVGPRPLIPEQLNAIPRKYFSRFTIKPGITGLAQINGRRNMDWKLQLKYDINYVKQKNLIFDLFIIISTFDKVIFSKNIVPSKHTKNWRKYL
jgi:lipopolysaccharide/colanic/teichoic acid biosynthesis glycosyltransferase